LVTQAQVQELLAAGLSYEQVGDRLGMHPGVAHLIATGQPAEWQPPQQPAERTPVLEWVRQQAAGDAQMLRAAAERDAGPVEAQDPDEVRDVLTVLTRDHDRVTALLEQLSAIPGHKQGGSPEQVARRQSLVDLVTIALSRHESAEEEHFWPAVRDALPDGAARAEQAQRQEQAGLATLAQLAETDPDSDRFDELVDQLVRQARQHVAFEDRVLLDLESAMDRDARERLGRKLRRAQRSGPTRPHPRAESGAAVGAPVAAIDRLRDAVGSRPARRRGQAEGERDSVEDEGTR
jgi:hypothetical protein